MTKSRVPYMPDFFKCTACKNTKPITEYYKMPRSKRGHHTQCKDCIKEYNAVNAEKNRARTAKWNAENRKHISELPPEEQKAIREKQRLHQAQYYKDNKEKCLAARRKYREENLEKCQQISREYYESHKDEINKAAMDRYYRLKDSDEQWYQNRLAATRRYLKKNRKKVAAKAKAKYHEQMKDPEYRAARAKYERERYQRIKAEKAQQDHDNDQKS